MWTQIMQLHVTNVQLNDEALRKRIDVFNNMLHDQLMQNLYFALFSLNFWNQMIRKDNSPFL